MAYDTAGLEAGLAAAVVLVAEARARTHMTTSRMLGDTALAGLAAAVVLVAEARAQPRARRKARIFVDFLRKICKDEQVGNVHTISVRYVQTQVCQHEAWHNDKCDSTRHSITTGHALGTS